MKPKQIFKTILSFTLALCLLVPFAACGETSENKVEVQSVELDSASLALDIGQTAKLSALVLPANATEKTETWLSSDPAVATVDAGTVTAVGAGDATIRVTIGGKSASCSVTVTDPATRVVAATGITLNKKVLSLEVGGSDLLLATILPENTTDKTVTWESSRPSVATVGINGMVTAMSAGSTVITAKTVNNRSASCIVTVTGAGGDDPVGGNGDSLYVGKVMSLEGRDDFIMGMDASAVPSLESAGVTYKNFDGETEDVYKILKDNGITDIRIRIWNDPYDDQHRTYGGGNCDLANAVAISKRCAQYGLGVIIDFHYSDFWADPGKQTIPKAWKNYSAAQVAGAIYDFTKDSLEEIKKTNVKITMVQIGNETTGGMAGITEGWTTAAATICDYMSHGSQAVRDVTGPVEKGGAKVAVHFTDPQSNSYVSFAQELSNYSVDYDVFGSSYYPYWHGTLDDLAGQLSMVHDQFQKEVMVLETSYAFTYEDADGFGNTGLTTITEPITLQGQSNAIRNVIQAIADLGDWGLGICYWEGTWIAASTSKDSAKNQDLCEKYGCGWATQYAHDYDASANRGACVIDNQAFFLSDGTPLESLKVFYRVREGADVDIAVDATVDQEVYYTVNQGPINLPSTVSITLNNGSVMEVEAFWSISDEELAVYITIAGMYTVTGTTLYGGTCTCYVWVSNPNLLIDGSFEDCNAYPNTDYFIQTGGLGDWRFDYTKLGEKLQLFVSNDSGNARMGSNSFHFWDEGAVQFKLHQDVAPAALSTYGYGRYGASFDIMGGDGINMKIYAYITLTYTDGTTKTFEGNTVELVGWLDWQRTSVSGVQIDSTVTLVTVGISVYAEFTGNGPWGNIDNAQFYFEEA